MTTLTGAAPPRRFVRHGMLPQLAAFQAVLRLGSVSRAAESLCIAQSTLSGQLRKLSDALGVELFDLHGKRLVPTHAAWTLQQTAQDVFDALDQCEQALACLRPVVLSSPWPRCPSPPCPAAAHLP